MAPSHPRGPVSTPSDADRAADGRAIPDLLAPGLRVVFCGINPGLRSASTGLHFARPGNRFWAVLQGAGFTEQLLTPSAQPRLLDVGIGITNLVRRSSATASEVTPAELRAGAAALADTAARWQPSTIAVLGLGAYRTAFRRPNATIGLQPEGIAGRALWLLPNPSGLQARYQLAEMVEQYQALLRYLDSGAAGSSAPRATGRSNATPLRPRPTHEDAGGAV